MSATFGEAAAALSGVTARLLGWRPDEFWRATPAELVSALGIGGEGQAPFDGERLGALIAQFPD